MNDCLIEEWRPVLGFEGRYEVSNLGRLKSFPKKVRLNTAILRATPDKAGYLYHNLYLAGASHHRKVHTVVAQAFHGPRPYGLVVRHLDGNHQNNVATNLAWGTHSENLLDQIRHGNHDGATKRACRQGHPLFGDNLYMNPTSGQRICRTCAARYKAEYQARKAS